MLPSSRPLLCLITDRKRLAASFDRPATHALTLLDVQLTAAIRAGVDLVQIREHDLDGGALVTLVRKAVVAARGTSTRVIVNDRVDVAIAAHAAGVHLRESSVATAQARALLPAGAIVGRSVHAADAAAHAGAVDYLIAGTVFPTLSKPQLQRSLGLSGLEAIAAAVRVPILAIGGVTSERIADLVEHGADGIAAIGAFIPAVEEKELAAAVEKVVRDLRFSFDTPAELP